MTLHRFAIVLAGATFVLLLVGGLVHGTGSGLACPDWPLCFGSALPKMEGHVLYEHSHRLVAGTVALLTVALAIALTIAQLRSRAARLPVALGWGAAALVLVQAVLGGLTVLLKLPTIVSTAHLAVSMLFFATTLLLVARTRPAAVLSSSSSSSVAGTAPAAPRGLIAVTTGAIYAQILLGGLVRHTGSGLACIDLPLCNGSLLPLSSGSPVLLQAVHRLMAVLVLLLVAGMTVAVVRRRATLGRGALTLALAAPLLVVVQGTLGVLSVLSYLELFRVTAHLGVAALLLADGIGLLLMTRSAPSLATAPAGAEPAMSPRLA